jgi:hypothetical protein
MFDAVINGGPLDPMHRGFLGLRTMFLALPLFPILALVEGRTAAANACVCITQALFPPPPFPLPTPTTHPPIHPTL